MALAGALVTSLFAADAPPAAQLDELDEVVVRATKPLPLEDFVEFPRYDSVAISPGGTRIAMGWTEDNFYRQLHVIEFPSLKPLDAQQLQQFLGVSDVRWVNDRKLLVQTDWPARGYRRIREFLGSILISDPGGRDLQVLNKELLSMADPGDEMRRLNAEVATRLGSQSTATRKAGSKPKKNAQGPVRIIAARTGIADQALFQTIRSSNSNDNTDGYGAFLLNVQNRDQQRLATLPVQGGQFVAGPDSRVALATGANAQNEQVVYFLPPEQRAGGEGLAARRQDRPRRTWPSPLCLDRERRGVLRLRRAAMHRHKAWWSGMHSTTRSGRCIAILPWIWSPSRSTRPASPGCSRAAIICRSTGIRIRRIRWRACTSR